jgi:hypothetical protein
MLLALRVAGVLLLALLFARPYRAGPSAEGADQEVALVIDRSASMGAISTGRTAFRRAQDAAEAVLKALPSRTAIHLAYADAAAVEPAQAPRIDRALEPGFAGTDHGRALDWARDRMLLSKRSRRTAYLITDLRRAASGPTAPRDWPEGVGLEIIDVGKPIARNLSVADARADRAEIRRGEPFVVTAVVANTGLFVARDVSVRLTLSRGDTTLRRVEKATVEPGATLPIRFVLETLTPGTYQGMVEVLADDDLPVDNARRLAFDARAPDPVLLLDGEPGRSVFQDETYYLESALRLRLPGQGPSATPYEPTRAARGGGEPLPDLGKFRVVIAANVADWSDAAGRIVRDQVIAGGHLVIFAGDHVVPLGYRGLGDVRVLPAEVGDQAEGGPFRLASWDKDHPIFRALSDPQHGDLRRLEFRQVTRLKPGAGARVLARLDNGDPWLVEGDLGAGKVLVFAVGADRDGGDWVIGRLFLPLVHQALGYLTGRLPESGGIQSLATGPGRLNPPGVEWIKDSLVVRNLDPRESEVERIPEREFRLAYHLPEARPGRKGKQAVAQIAPPAGSLRPDELWRPLVWGLLVVLVVETFVANRTQAS